MRRLFFIVILFSLPIVVNSQLIGSLRLPSKNEIAKTPIIETDSLLIKKDLPSRVDNTLLPYFRGVFMQSGGSCAQASGIGYSFTYEINRIRNTNAKLPVNQFPTHYTYNFLNDGSALNGSFYTDGWEIIKSNGCPTVADYGGLYHDEKFWLNGYQYYENGFDNRVLDYYIIDVSNSEGLLKLKNWLANHLDGSQYGGLANFAAGVTGSFTMVGDSLITQWGTQVNHAMTIVGWDDSVKFDVNNDGKFTNDIDINNDGKVDMKDWEIGALIMVNSWGENFGQQGKAYFLYRLLALPASEGGIFENKVWVIKVRKHYKPTLFIRTKLSYPKRNHLIITAGISQNLHTSIPKHRLFLPVFYKQGGEYPLNGQDSTPLQLSLDITPLLTYINPNKPFRVFLIVKEFDADNLYDGQIFDFQVIDSANNVYISKVRNVEINNNSETYLWTDIQLNINKPQIDENSLPNYSLGSQYYYSITANGGVEPYNWNLLYDYREKAEKYQLNQATDKLLPNNYDDGFVSYVLPFSFPFYGKMYDTVYIGTDGWIKFDRGFDYIRTDQQIMKNNVIGIFASDLQIYPNKKQGIFYNETQDSVVVIWKTGFWGDSIHNTDFGVVLYRTGVIKMFYNKIDDQALDTNKITYASGISAGDKTNFFIASHSGGYPISESAVNFEPVLMPIGLYIDINGTIRGEIETEKGYWRLGVKVSDYQRLGDVKFFDFGKKFDNVSGLKLYPNPADDFVAINFNINSQQTVIMQLLSVDGKILSNNEYFLSEGDHTVILDISCFKHGFYIVRLIANGKISSGKLLVK